MKGLLTCLLTYSLSIVGAVSGVGVVQSINWKASRWGPPGCQWWQTGCHCWQVVFLVLSRVNFFREIFVNLRAVSPW